ncbi:MAG: hypothetical protein L3J68_01340 [Thermoplasmata archaeon]|nr:hypothetical protein [Thermoplasmata archaeon]
MPSRKVLDWLLAEDQPSIRYRTLTELLGRPERDPEVRAAKTRIPETGWAAEILAERSPEGWWVNSRNFYQPKYLSTNWKMLMLSDLGMTRADDRVGASCEWWMERSATRYAWLPGSKSSPHHCVAGNMARALIRFGYTDDRRVRRVLEWLVKTAHPKGGWTCWSFGNGPASGRNLDSWEGLSALAAYPRSKRTASMQSAVEQGAEFFLERELHRQGARYRPWYRFHYPVHYYYDILVGLDIVTALGYGSDPRLRFALGLLKKKRRADGRWNLDAVHPDVEGAGAAEWYRKHPKDRPTPVALEVRGKPSKMITLTALKVLARVES